MNAQPTAYDTVTMVNSMAIIYALNARNSAIKWWIFQFLIRVDLKEFNWCCLKLMSAVIETIAFKLQKHANSGKFLHSLEKVTFEYRKSMLRTTSNKQSCTFLIEFRRSWILVANHHWWVYMSSRCLVREFMAKINMLISWKKEKTVHKPHK